MRFTKNNKLLLIEGHRHKTNPTIKLPCCASMVKKLCLHGHFADFTMYAFKQDFNINIPIPSYCPSLMKEGHSKVHMQLLLQHTLIQQKGLIDSNFMKPLIYLDFLASVSLNQISGKKCRGELETSQKAWLES